MDNRLRYYLQKTKSLPPEVVIKNFFSKVGHKGLNTICKISANIFGTEMTDTEFLTKVWNSKYQFKNLGELQKYFRERKEPKFFIDSLKREDIVPLIYEHFPDASDKIIAQADKICDRIFDLLGSGEVKLGNKINWHCDFKSGYRWNPQKYYKDIKIPYGKADIKIPWELSRFQHLSVLGEAYWWTNDEKYVREFVNQVSDWIDNNKPNFGVNWCCTMDVAIRACNWLLGWEFFKDSKVINQQFLFKFLKSLYQHGCHIMRNLEKSEVLTSNHYLADITGLVYLGVAFPEFKDAKKWKEFGIKELIKEMEKQVYPDGCDFEASTCYHRLVLELFLFSTLLVVINNNDFKGENYRETAEKIFGKEYTDRLYKMFNVVLYLLKPNGRIPQIGDNDNGRFHIFTNREVLDMRYLLALGTIFFKEPKFKIKEFGFCEEALWIFGKEGYKIWHGLKKNCLADVKSKAFPDAGWYVMRDNKNYCIISCGPNGQNGNGGHCHNDKLSFELCINGKDVIVDPGTYVYTSEPEWRNKFRSTAGHNTVVVDNQEQNRFGNKNLFWMKNDTKVKIDGWKTSGEYDFLDARLSGYEYLSDAVTDRRQLLFNKKEGYWGIKDILTGKGKHTFDLYFHFAPMKLEVHKEDPLVVNSNIKGRANIVIVPMQTEELKVSIEEGGVSCSYGKKVQAPVVKYSKTVKAPVEFVTVIYPYSSSKLLSTVEESFQSFEDCRSK